MDLAWSLKTDDGSVNDTIVLRLGKKCLRPGRLNSGVIRRPRFELQDDESNDPASGRDEEVADRRTTMWCGGIDQGDRHTL